MTNLSVIVDSSKSQRVGKEGEGRLKKTRNVSKLIQLVDKATRNFVSVGEEIASENPDFQVSSGTTRLRLTRLCMINSN